MRQTFYDALQSARGFSWLIYTWLVAFHVQYLPRLSVWKVYTAFIWLAYLFCDKDCKNRNQVMKICTR